jgi:hypothetical protein
MFNRVIDNYRLYGNNNYNAILNDSTVFKDEFFTKNEKLHFNSNNAMLSWNNIQNPSWGSVVIHPLALPSPRKPQYLSTIDDDSIEIPKKKARSTKQMSKSKESKSGKRNRISDNKEDLNQKQKHKIQSDYPRKKSKQTRISNEFHREDQSNDSDKLSDDQDKDDDYYHQDEDSDDFQDNTVLYDSSD